MCTCEGCRVPRVTRQGRRKRAGTVCKALACTCTRDMGMRGRRSRLRVAGLQGRERPVSADIFAKARRPPNRGSA